MADAFTAFADSLVPDVWHPYVVQKSLEKSAFIQSGVMTNMSNVLKDQIGGNDPGIDGGGVTVNMPFWDDLDGADEVIDDTKDLEVSKIGSGKDVAIKLLRQKAFGATDLAADLAGSDPMETISDRFADYWQRRYQEALFSVLQGVMGTTKSGGSMASNVLDISALSGAAAYFEDESFIDACGKLGDIQDVLAATAVHSDVYTQMKKDDLIDYFKPSDGGKAIGLYQGKRLIVDDKCPKTSGGVYTSYIFGNGAVGYASGKPKNPVESGRDPLKNSGRSYLVNRMKYMIHVRGVAWDPASGVPAATTPTNAELGAGTNWKRVYDAKNVRVVAYKHKLG